MAKRRNEQSSCTPTPKPETAHKPVNKSPLAPFKEKDDLEQLAPLEVVTPVNVPESNDNQLFSVRDLENNVSECLKILDDTVMHAYVTKLSDLPVIEPFFDEIKMKNEPYQFFHITKLVYEQDEFSVSKLSTIFQSLSGKNCTLVLMVKNVGHNTNFYLGVRNHEEKEFTGTLRQMLEKSLKGQFPGSDFNPNFSVEDMQTISDELKVSSKAISCVSCVPDFKQDKDFFENKDFLQGLEKFVVSMQNENYTAIFVADAIPYDELSSYRVQLESVYTQLSPFANMQYQINTNKSSSTSNAENTSKTNTETDTSNEQYSKNTQQSHTVGTGSTDTKSETDTHTTSSSTTDTTTKTDTETNGTMESSTDSTSTTKTVSAGINANSSKFSSVTNSVSNAISKAVSVNGEAAGAAIGAAIGSIIPGAGTVVGGIVGGFIGKSVTGSLTKSVTTTVANAVGNSLGIGVNAGFSRAKTQSHSDTTGTSHSTSLSNSVSKALTKGVSDSKSYGSSHAVSQNVTDGITTGSSEQFGTSKSYSEAFSFGHTETITDTLGTSQGITMQSQNMMIVNMLERIKKQIARIDECESIGMWNCAAYFMSSNRAISETAASTYRSLISGENSGVERSAINTWTDNERLPALTTYITHFCHPKFVYLSADEYNIVSPASLISTKELAIEMGLPRKSVCGLPVIEHAVYGQQVVINDTVSNNKTKADHISLGKVYHLSSKTDVSVQLDMRSLTMHTFVTGSTGAGKSNTVYHIIDELSAHKIPYLVIEPAKGEYKTKFTDAQVFGTNPNNGRLLKLNPFAFPKEIHVQEHIDRLAELFNVCWVMYAAMPAVLKDSIIRAYESAGWDMNKSINTVNDGLFPTFEDVLREIDVVIQESDYSGDTSSDYKGALKTRLRSLTNGINGMIFSSREISNQELFDSKTIVDLSRVGSTETKSLMMGVLVLKLQEYRMSTHKETDSNLSHITVLEEAHNLLKKTSTEQGQETANLQGKSVEMLTNAIAEMRTYGEGFIIVDQAPDLLDTAVIRNTNTKIVMRLPEGTDREITGLSMALDENQVKELSKLPQGVAAVYQNNWQEAVLCAMPEFKFVDLPQSVKKQTTGYDERQTLKLLLSGGKMTPSLLHALVLSDAPAKVRRALIQNFEKNNIVFEWAMADYITSRFNWKIVFEGTNRSCSTIDELGELMLSNIEAEFSGFSREETGRICYYICRKAHELFPTNTEIENVRVDFFKKRWLI